MRFPSVSNPRRQKVWLGLIVAGVVLAGWGEWLRWASAEDGPAEADSAAAPVEEVEEVEEAEPEPEGEELDPVIEALRTKEESFAGQIVVIPIRERDLIAGSRFDFMQRILKRADDEGAVAVILDMNTPGGLAWESGELIMDHLSRMSIPTYTYVNRQAASAGSVIAVGTDSIYMAPTSAIGAALAVPATGGELGETMEKKMDSYMRAQMRSVAKAKGHNPDIAEAFVDDQKEVTLEVGEDQLEKYPTGFVTISKKGEVLSLDHEQATEIINGKPVLAKGIAKDVEDLVAQEGLKGEITIAEPLGMEAFAHLIARFSAILLMLGIAGAYLEIQSPGFGIPGAVSIICFATFFFGHYLAGKMAGFEMVAVFILGLVLVGVEIFLFPGTLIFGITGAAMMLGSLLYTMAGASPLEGAGSFSLNVEGLSDAALNLTLGLAGAIILVAILMKYLPDTRAMNWLILRESIPEGGSLGLTADSGDAFDKLERKSAEVGDTGVTITGLRPAGKGRFDGEILDIVSDAEFIENGIEVRIIAREGAKIVVTPVG